MKQILIMDLAKAAKRDGLTLPWCLTHLAEQVERNQQRLEQQSRRDRGPNIFFPQSPL